MIGVLEIEVYGSDIVMVDSVLDVFKILVGRWHAELKHVLVYSLLWILESVTKQVISLFKLLSESKLGHFVVYLCELLHLNLVFAEQVFFLLSKISKVVGWRSRVDLS
jgi:hypothetical protein